MCLVVVLGGAAYAGVKFAYARIAFIVAALAGALVGAAILGIVRFGHCRHPWLAAVTSVSLGLLWFAAQFFVLMLATFGADQWTRFDRLPEFLELCFRIGPRAPGVNAPPTGWIFLFVEILAVIAVPVIVALHAVSRPFSEEMQRWLDEGQAFFPPGSLAEVVTRLSNFQPIPSDLEPLTGEMPERADRAVLHYGPGGDGQGGPVYLSIRPNGQIFPRPLVYCWQLTETEIARVGRWFSGFQMAVAQPRSAPQSPGLRRASNDADAVIRECMTDPPVFSGWGTVILNAIPLMQIVVFFLAMGLALWAIRSRKMAVGLTLFFIGFGALFVVRTRFKYRLRTRMLSPKLLRRPTSLVEPNDPEAYFVEVVPRENWTKLLWDDAADHGFLKLDDVTRCLLFEGDRERWSIPVSAILRIHDEAKVKAGTGAPHSSHFVVVAVQFRESVWELPIHAMLDGGGRLLAGNSYQAAQILCSRLNDWRLNGTS